MKNILRSLICVSFLLTLSFTGFGQKYGHVNLGNLLTQLPEINEGSTALENFRLGISQELEVKVTAWENKYKMLSAKVDELTPNEAKAKEQELKEEQQSLLTEEKLIGVKVNQKRQEIMTPILQKVDDAVQAIGKENGYTMIFDSSVPNAFLYAQETIDLSTQVLAKLGVK